MTNLPTWLQRLLERAKRDNAAFTDAPGFVFGARNQRHIDDGDYGDPTQQIEVYTDEDGQAWLPTHSLRNGE